MKLKLINGTVNLSLAVAKDMIQDISGRLILFKSDHFVPDDFHSDEGKFTSIYQENVSIINKYLKPVIRVGGKLMVILAEDWLKEYKEG